MTKRRGTDREGGFVDRSAGDGGEVLLTPDADVLHLLPARWAYLDEVAIGAESDDFWFGPGHWREDDEGPLLSVECWHVTVSPDGTAWTWCSND